MGKVNKKAKQKKHVTIETSKSIKTVTEKVVKTTKNSRKNYDANCVKGAIDDIGKGLSVRKTSIKWNIPRTTLQDWKHGRTVPEDRPGPKPILTSQEENLLVEWIIELGRRGIPLKKNNLLDSIQKIIKDDGRPTIFKDGRPGQSWFNCFLDRHPEIAQRNAESISRARGALTEGCIRGWFDDAEKLFKDKKIEYVLQTSSLQYNGDETGSQLDPKTGKVLAKKGENIYTESGGDKQQITVLVTTRADGKIMNSVIVYPYKTAVPKNIIDKLPERFSAARSESGWMNSEIFFEYFANIFIPELNEERRKKRHHKEGDVLILDETDWIVYWMDGYSSHLTLHTSKICDENKILLYCFKAHSSHITQPNDVGPFKPLKQEWKNAMSEWRLDNPYQTLNKINFSTVLDKAMSKLNKESVISGYRATGLFPFNADAVNYAKLTATNREKFDSKAFSKVPTLAKVEATETEISLRCMEGILGEDLVSLYNNVATQLVLNLSTLPDINAYLVWYELKKRLLEETESRK